jgi:L-cysteate sulfo-lyase
LAAVIDSQRDQSCFPRHLAHTGRAGLVKELGPQRVVGVHTGAVDDPRGTVAGLLGGTIDPAGLRIDEGHVGAGYATLTDAVRDALSVAARAS